MKTKNRKKIHHSNEDMSFAVGAAIAATGLILLILFSLILCSTRYTLKNYYQKSLEVWQEFTQSENLPAEFEKQPAEVKQNLEKCELALKKFQK